MMEALSTSGWKGPLSGSEDEEPVGEGAASLLSMTRNTCSGRKLPFEKVLIL